MAKSAGCLFCSIVRGEISAQTVFDDEIALAFLDHRPLFHGHCLLVPKTHYETLSDLPPELLGPLFERTQMLARVVESAMQAAGTFVAMNNRVSQSVPHLHIHVVPRRPKDGLKGFFWPRTKYASDEAMAETAERIRKELSARA
jgi:histidine triad (HIT) family protein